MQNVNISISREESRKIAYKKKQQCYKVPLPTLGKPSFLKAGGGQVPKSPTVPFWSIKIQYVNVKIFLKALHILGKHIS